MPMAILVAILNTSERKLMPADHNQIYIMHYHGHIMYIAVLRSTVTWFA